MYLISKLKVLTFSIILIGTGAVVINSCVHAPYILPVNQRTGDPNICFEQDVLPIFQSNCAKSHCHDSHGAGGYRLDNYKDIVSNGIVPGNPAASRIFESMNNGAGENFMPKDGTPLTATELNVIRLWIATGAIDSGACSTNNCDTTQFTYTGTIQPMIQLHCVGCHVQGSAGGSLTDYLSVRNAAVNGKLIGDISHLTGYNAMPLGGTQLLACQITQVKEWVAAGAPDN
jgi:hypothetical protein